jgi:hypothetical protein
MHYRALTFKQYKIKGSGLNISKKKKLFIAYICCHKDELDYKNAADTVKGAQHYDCDDRNVKSDKLTL